MKTLKLLTIALVLPLVFHAQKSLTGLWVGTLDNDSATVRKDQAFEIALTEYRGKVYGYSRMTFTVNDTLYYIIKRVKGKIEDEICQVKDDEIIRHNFPRQPDKGVKLISTFRRNLEDSIWKLDGDWKTTESKRHGYYSISGKISLSSEPDFSKSKLFPHLEELNLDKDVAFYVASKKSEPNYQQRNQNTGVARNNVAAEPDQEIATASLRKTDAPASSITVQNKTITPEAGKPEVSNTLSSVKPVNETVPDDNATATLKKVESGPDRLPSVRQNDLSSNLQRPKASQAHVPIKPNEPVITENSANSALKTGEPMAMPQSGAIDKIEDNAAAPVVNKPTGLVAQVAQRKQAAPQFVEFKSDSLVIKLYDNGEIDGDTVSVLLNGEVLMAHQGLKASAIKKTIYIEPGQDEMTLVLYAENLGKYPPNTGLLVINDGDATYQLRFSADLQQNAAVVFRRKK